MRFILSIILIVVGYGFGIAQVDTCQSEYLSRFAKETQKYRHRCSKELSDELFTKESNRLKVLETSHSYELSYSSQNDQLLIEMNVAPWNDHHLVDYCNDKIYYINNQIHIGTKYNLPENKLHTLTIIINGKKRAVKSSFFNKLYNLNKGIQLLYAPQKERYYIEFSCGDGGAFQKVVIEFDQDNIYCETFFGI